MLSWCRRSAGPSFVKPSYGGKVEGDSYSAGWPTPKLVWPYVSDLDRHICTAYRSDETAFGTLYEK